MKITVNNTFTNLKFKADVYSKNEMVLSEEDVSFEKPGTVKMLGTINCNSITQKIFYTYSEKPSNILN